MYKKLLFLLFVIPVSLSVFAQYNFNAGYPVVYNILNTKCSNAGCHSAASADALKFDGSPAAVYAQLVGQAPANAAAQTRGEQLVWMDQPYQSYLLKKAGSWFDTDLGLPAGEPDSAAHVNAGLSNVQVEYIRQWILDSAAQFSLNIDTSIINDYYNDIIRIAFFPKLAAPAAGAGMQVRYGPIFVRNIPGQNEVEYMLMRQINFPTDMEVIGVRSSMSSESHHFLLFQFPDSNSGLAEQVGLRKVSIGSAGIVTPFDGNKNLIAAWQTPSDIELPGGTAFFWPKNTYIDQDYHVKNYTQVTPGRSGIVPFDFFLNVYTRPRVVTDNTIEMKSQLVNNASLFLNPNIVTTIQYPDPSNLGNNTRYLWMMSSHTHKFGTGFNIYKYDTLMPGGIGDTLYKGTYDYANGIDAGVYDWEHPSVEYFSPQKSLDFRTSGVICQTVWNNTSGNYIHFGFTTSDEMQLFYYMYTDQLPAGAATGVKDIKPSFDFNVYPNPMSEMGNIAYTLTDAASVGASVLDITGKEIASLKNEKEQPGTYNVNIGKQQMLSAGMYFARVTVNGESYTKKFIVE
jgi:hypothetical protein